MCMINKEASGEGSQGPLRCPGTGHTPDASRASDGSWSRKRPNTPKRHSHWALGSPKESRAPGAAPLAGRTVRPKPSTGAIHPKVMRAPCGSGACGPAPVGSPPSRTSALAPGAREARPQGYADPIPFESDGRHHQARRARKRRTTRGGGPHDAARPEGIATCVPNAAHMPARAMRCRSPVANRAEARPAPFAGIPLPKKRNARGTARSGTERRPPRWRPAAGSRIGAAPLDAPPLRPPPHDPRAESCDMTNEGTPIAPISRDPENDRGIRRHPDHSIERTVRPFERPPRLRSCHPVPNGLGAGAPSPPPPNARTDAYAYHLYEYCPLLKAAR